MDQKLLKIIWFLGFICLVLGAALALGAVSYDYLIGSTTHSIGDSQLGAFFVALAVTLFGAFLLKFVANEHLRSRISGLEGVHKSVKAAPLSIIKKLFHPIGMLGALIGIGMMLGLILKDYKAPLTFSIGPMQTLAIFGGSVISIAGISFMSSANTFLSTSMHPMLQQFEGLTKEEPTEKPKRKLKVKVVESPETPGDGMDVPKVDAGIAPHVVPKPIPAPGPVAAGTTVEPAVAEAPSITPIEEPLKYSPAPSAEGTSVPSTSYQQMTEPQEPEAPTQEMSSMMSEVPSWSDRKAEELALEALKEAEAELGLGAIASDMSDAQSSKDETTEAPVPETAASETVPVEISKEISVDTETEAATTQEAVVEVFECPSCHKSVGESDLNCPNCGASFDDDEDEGAEAVIELEAEPEEPVVPTQEFLGGPEPIPEPPAPEPPAPLPKPLPPLLPPPLPPPLPSSKKKKASPKKEVRPSPTPTKVPPLPSVEPAVSKGGSTDEENGTAGSSGILQSILDEITKRDDEKANAEEPETVEDDVASEVPKTCPNCGRKMKPRWRSCPFCGLEFR